MKTVFFDIDTQNDFMLPAGALYAPGAELILPVVARLNSFAAAQGIPLLSTTDAHAENDPEFQSWPAHCVRGTLGQQKPLETLLERRAALPSSPADVVLAPQVLIEKQHLDCFANANLPSLLARLGAERYVVYGVVTEYCVRFAVEGLLKTGKRIEVVTDAVRTLSPQDGAFTLATLAAGGAHLTTVDRVAG